MDIADCYKLLETLLHSDGKLLALPLQVIGSGWQRQTFQPTTAMIQALPLLLLASLSTDKSSISRWLLLRIKCQKKQKSVNARTHGKSSVGEINGKTEEAFEQKDRQTFQKAFSGNKIIFFFFFFFFWPKKSMKTKKHKIEILGIEMYRGRGTVKL